MRPPDIEREGWRRSFYFEICESIARATLIEIVKEEEEDVEKQLSRSAKNDGVADGAGYLHHAALCLRADADRRSEK
jgi:hypothetical protein